MEANDIQRLRHFALGTSLSLLTYVAAGVSINTPMAISAFGVPIQIQRPELLPIALALASFYATYRYCYFAVMLGSSLYRVRRDILDGLYTDQPPIKLGPFPRASTYFGPAKFTSSPWYDDHGLVKKQAEAVRRAFPKFAGARVTAEPIHNETTDEDGTERLSWAVSCHIPARCRLACLIEDFDYTLPILLNVFTLAWYILRLVR